VVVRGHFAHPGTGEIIARAIDAAIQEHGIDPGVFSFIQGGGRAVGSALVQHPLIKAVGFTGSLAGGRALFDLCAQRAEPIPFFGELGSVNPMFLLPNAQAARGQSIGAAWAGSLTMGAGQFCTNPGIAVVIDGPSAQVFIDAAQHALAQTAPQTMLTDDIATAFRAGRDQMAASPGVQVALMQDTEGRRALPALLVVQGDDWLANPQLSHEVFGPLGLVIRLRDMAQMQDVAAALQGQLTCTLHVDPQDYPEAQMLLPTLERKAGRLLVNGFPTGVEVCDAQVHGGPYPASTNFGATSVGTLSIRRWLRPVAYQNFPAELLPLDC
jgi:NADP-dependent aldehyde dehydrogenase